MMVVFSNTSLFLTDAAVESICHLIKLPEMHTIMQYGYQGDISLNWKSQNASDRDKLGHIMATQVLIWETVVGERDSSFNHVSTGGKDTVKSMIGKENPCFIQIYLGEYRPVKIIFSSVSESKQYKSLIPFNNETVPTLCLDPIKL